MSSTVLVGMLYTTVALVALGREVTLSRAAGHSRLTSTLWGVVAAALWPLITAGVVWEWVQE